MKTLLFIFMRWISNLSFIQFPINREDLWKCLEKFDKSYYTGNKQRYIKFLLVRDIFMDQSSESESSQQPTLCLNTHNGTKFTNNSYIAIVGVWKAHSFTKKHFFSLSHAHRQFQTLLHFMISTKWDELLTPLAHSSHQTRN